LRVARQIIPYFVLLVAALAQGQPQDSPSASRTAIVVPFENASGAPGLEWISEAFPEILSQRLSSPGIFVLTRDDRLRAYDRAGIPSELHATRATMYRLMEQLDVDYVVMGRFEFDGRTFTATARWLDMEHKRLLPESQETGPIVNLVNVQTALAWDLLHTLHPDLNASKDVFLGSAPAVRLDAFENYVKGILATTSAEKAQHFQEAARLIPTYNEAWLQLGKAYLEQHEYDQTIVALQHVSEVSTTAREANFYAGLAAFSLGDFSRAQSNFDFVSARLPLTEVENNLGVVAARLGNRRNAMEHFQKIVAQDPNDADYHFNLAIELYQAGDMAGATRELKQCLQLHPTDAEASSLLVAISTARPPDADPRAQERIKPNYDENSFRQLMVGIESAAEERLAAASPEVRAQFYLSRGEELYVQGFVGESEKRFRQAITLAPASAEAHMAMAQALEADGDVAGARAQAEAALNIRIYIDPLLLLARLDLRDNRTDAAAESVDRALKLDPANSSALSLKRAVAAKLAEKAQPLPN
jgi:tetratricopeptide (TPR) repeat protein